MFNGVIESEWSIACRLSRDGVEQEGSPEGVKDDCQRRITRFFCCFFRFGFGPSLGGISNLYHHHRRTIPLTFAFSQFIMLIAMD
jgi:hypothetical protein